MNQITPDNTVESSAPVSFGVCEYCGSLPGAWMPVHAIDDMVLIGIREINAYKRSNPGYQVKSEGVERCRFCGSRKADIARSCQAINGEMVKLETIKQLAPRMYDIAKSLPIQSTLIYGATGVGKTLTLKYWFNRYLYDIKGQKVIFLTERELMAKFDLDRDPERELNELLMCHAIFMDEVLEKDNWPDRNSETTARKRNYAKIFIDALYEDRNKLIIATSNNTAMDIKSLADAPQLVRRFGEVFSKKIEVGR